MTKRADNAVATTRRAHWAVIIICIATLVATILRAPTDSTLALQQAIFLVNLSTSSGEDTDGFVISYAKHKAIEIVPFPVRSFLDRGQWTVMWEEKEELAALRGRLFDTPDLPSIEAASEFTEAIIDNIGVFDLDDFSDDPAYLGTSCVDGPELDSFLVGHPLESSDLFEEGPFNGHGQSEFDHLWGPAENLANIFDYWEMIEDLYFWFPVEQSKVGRIAISNYSSGMTLVNLPASLSSRISAHGECDIPIFSLKGPFRRFSAEVRISDVDISDGMRFDGGYMLLGFLSYPGAYEGAGWENWYFVDQNGVRLTPSPELTISFDVVVHRVNGQELFLQANPDVRSPPEFEFGNAITSFGVLHDYARSKPFLLNDSLESVVSRLEQEVQAQSASRELKLFGVSVPISRVGVVGLIALLLAQTYLALHMRLLSGVLQTQETDESWLGLHTDSASSLAFFVSMGLAPAGTAFWLASSAASELADYDSIGLWLVGMPVLGSIFAAIYFALKAANSIRKSQ